jgi:tetratricopeptide (TPR) repeat protein
MQTWGQTKLWGDTRELLGHALAVGSEGPILRVDYGRQLEVRGEREAALAEFDTAIRLDPRYGEAWYSRGNVLKLLGRFQEAIDAYEHAGRTMPDSWRADIALGLLFHERLNQLAPARAAFEAAVKKVESPGSQANTGRAHILLAAVLDEMGDEKGCREMLLRAARYEDTKAEAMQHLRDYQ